MGKMFNAAGDRLVEGAALTLPPLPAIDAPPPQIAPPVNSKLAKQIKAAVIAETPEYIVLNKPAGIASQGGSRVVWSIDNLAASLVPEGDASPKLVHRLDKDTSGVMMLAKTAMAARKLGELFRSRDMRKCYLAITVGVPEKREGRFVQRLAKLPTPHGGEMVQVDVKGQSAVTDYIVLDTLGKRYALVALWPRTGRTHQLRVHLAHNGTHILGDEKYGLGTPPDRLPDGLMLHALRLSWPGLKKPLMAPIPPDFAKAMEILGLSFTAGNDPFEGMD
jgi:23S rRNA pseudouridine955/2504/2580 synthase